MMERKHLERWRLMTRAWGNETNFHAFDRGHPVVFIIKLQVYIYMYIY